MLTLLTPLGIKTEMACQRFIINVTSLYIFRRRNGYRYFYGPNILWVRLVRDFGGEDEIKSLRIFSKSSTINGFGMPLLTTV